MSLALEKIKLVKGIDPVADAFAGTADSDVVTLENFQKALFLIYKGVGATGTADITVMAASDNSKTGAEAVAFKYTSITSGETSSSVTAATSSGFTTTAGSSQLYAVEVQSVDLPDGKPYVFLRSTEDTNDPVLGGVLIQLTGGRHAGDPANFPAVTA